MSLARLSEALVYLADVDTLLMAAVVLYSCLLRAYLNW